MIEGGHEVIADSFGGDRVRHRVIPRRGAIRDADPDQQ
jgi:heat shock protein HspQ